MAVVAVAVSWAAGIWLARLAWSRGWVDCDTPGMAGWLALLAAVGLASVLAARRPRLRAPAALAAMLLLGGWRYQLHPFEPCFGPGDLAHYNGGVLSPAWGTVIGTVVRPAELRDARVRVRLRAERVQLGQEEAGLPVRGDALFTVERGLDLRYGDQVAVRGRLEAPPVFEDFDYRAYLARQGVHTLIQRPEVQVLSRGGGSPFWRGLYAVREASQGVIGRLLPEPEAALLTGILLGVESGIDPALYDQFNRTGTSHVIVISGLNVLDTYSFPALRGPRQPRRS